jgi:plastocyanin
MTKRALIAPALVAALSAIPLLAAACGGSGDDAGAAPPALSVPAPAPPGAGTGPSAETADDTTPPAETTQPAPSAGDATAPTSAPSEQTASEAEGTLLELSAEPTGLLAFDKTTLDARAGKVTIRFTNPSSVPHNVAIEGNGVDVVSDTVQDGETTSVTADLPAGTYTFLCDVPGHEEAGMKGTLTVS